MAVPAFKANPETRARLGRIGLEAVSRNLWAADCQTCGSPLGLDSPSLIVLDYLVAVDASLHHPECRQPEWSQTAVVSSQPLLTFTTRMMLIPSMMGGRRVDRPTFLVNPSLESVTLWRDSSGGYRVATVDYYAEFGLVAPSGVLDPTDRVVNAAAWLTDHELIVRLGSAVWAASHVMVDEPILATIRESGVVWLAVSTAVHPTLLTDHRPVEQIFRSGEVAVGLVELNTSEPAPTAPPRLQMKADGTRDEDVDWLPERVNYAGPTYDPVTGRFEAGTGMDGPTYWTLNTSGKGVECGLLYGPAGTGKTNMMRIIGLEAYCSTVFNVLVADVTDRNGICDSLATLAEKCARTVSETMDLLKGMNRVINARLAAGEYGEPTPKTPGLLLLIDDAQLVLRNRRAARLAERIVTEGAGVGVGLVATTTSVDLIEFAGNRALLLGLSAKNSAGFDRWQSDQLRALREAASPQ